MPDITLDWKQYEKKAVQVTAEGAVLIKNDGVLPLTSDTKVALFGRMQNNYIKSGSGSGGMVNVSHVVTIREALEKDPRFILDSDLISFYEDFEKQSPFNPGVGWGQEPWSQVEAALNEDDVKTYASRNDLGIIVISRSAGEDRDNIDEKGAYRLSDEEEDMIKYVCGNFSKSVVLLNVGNIIDMSFVTKYSPSAVFYIWQGGMVGAKAVPLLLTGDITPSGHLPDTIAFNISDYPSNDNFGNKNDSLKDFYQEDIFVGYRFFETFAPERVMYPFGFGLTYTEFKFSDFVLSKDGDFGVTVKFKVTNEGSFKGKATPMLWAKAPNGKLGKASKVLCGFYKTEELMPGESEEITIVTGCRDFASFDDEGVTGFRYSWVLEAGTYEFFIGENSSDTVFAGSFGIDELYVIETLKSAMAPFEAFDRITATENSDGSKKLTYKAVPLAQTNNLNDRLKNLPPEIPQTGDRGIKLSDVINGKASDDEFLAQLSDEDLMLIIRGEGMGSPKVTTGTAGAFAGTSAELKSYGIPSCCCSDGPSGMRIDSGKKAFSLPNGTCIAATFNTTLITELFDFFGKEMISNEIDVVLGPGMNIHRHPLNGRNFEYFSEDPFLSGTIAGAELKGLQSNGVTGCIKHFCCNNREKNRLWSSSVVSERALREIYMRGFEKAIREYGATCIMTVYNRINGIYGCADYDLTTVVLREQWGFKGIVMSDWWPFVSAEAYGEADKNLHSYCARAQNDLYMCCSSVEKKYLNTVNVPEVFALHDDSLLTRADLQRCARNIIDFSKTTIAMRRLMGETFNVNHIDSPFSDDLTPAKADVYHEVTGDETIIAINDEDSMPGKDIILGITVDKPGSYDIVFEAEADGSLAAQIPMTVFYTSIPVCVITWNGNDGGRVQKTMTGYCRNIHSIFRLHFAVGGVRIKNVIFRRLDADVPHMTWGLADEAKE